MENRLSCVLHKSSDGGGPRDAFENVFMESRRLAAPVESNFEMDNGRLVSLDLGLIRAKADYIGFILKRMSMRMILPLLSLALAMTVDGLAQGDKKTDVRTTKAFETPAAKVSKEERSPIAAAPRDGQHDFDFDIGVWKTHLWRLLHPLTGSNEWTEYQGTTVVRKIWNGRANLAELEADGPTGHLQVLSLRLYNPQSCQWSLYAANSRSGTLSVPTVGEFKNGRGEFFDQEVFNDRTILVRNVWSDITLDSCRFEQAFSTDGGKTWEVNWIAIDTRAKK
jgi:hypothetical protein